MRNKILQKPTPPPLLIIREGIDPCLPKPIFKDEEISGMVEWKKKHWLRMKIYKFFNIDF